MNLVQVKSEAKPGGLIRDTHIDALASKSLDDSIITVGDSGQHNDIKSAYDSASEGQLVWVSPGNYTLNETIVLKNNISIYFAPESNIYGTTGGIGNGVFFTDGGSSITASIFGCGNFYAPEEWNPRESVGQSQYLLGLSGNSKVFVYLNDSDLGGYYVNKPVYDYNNSISGDYIGAHSNLVGYNNKALGYFSHAEGNETSAIGGYSHTEGNASIATGDFSHAEGYSTLSSGRFSHAEGSYTTSAGEHSHAEGSQSKASGDYSHAEGWVTSASGNYSHAQGYETLASGLYSHAEGKLTEAIGGYSHAEGGYTTAIGEYSHAAGFATTAAGGKQYIIGKYNVPQGSSPILTATSDSAFIIGNGTSTANKADAFRVTWDGDATCDGAFTGGGADYAESFEWEDGNPNNEDRVGYFVELNKSDKIKLFETEGDEPLGIISGRPAVIGDEGANRWVNKYVTDKWGRIQYETVDITNTNILTKEVDVNYEIQENDEIVETTMITEFLTKEVDEYYELQNGEEFATDTEENIIVKYKIEREVPKIIRYKEIIKIGEEMAPILNPDFDPNFEYTPRLQRKEWDAVGLLGKLRVRDDGTCIDGGWCKPISGGTVTKTTKTANIKYKVLKRIDNETVLILFK